MLHFSFPSSEKDSRMHKECGSFHDDWVKEGSSGIEARFINKEIGNFLILKVIPLENSLNLYGFNSIFKQINALLDTFWSS